MRRAARASRYNAPANVAADAIDAALRPRPCRKSHAMIRAKLCFVAEGVSNDRETDQVSAFNFYEHFAARSYPASVQRIAFFCLLERAPADPARCRAEFSISLDGEDVVRQPVDLDFGTLPHCRCTIRVDGFAPQRPGTILFRLAIPGHDAAEYSVTATTSPATATGRAAAAGAFDPIWNSGQYTASIGTVNVNHR
jgi:hypothetical protein